MLRKLSLLIVVFVLSFFVITSTEAATIVWVSEWLTNAQGISFDQGWIDLLKAEGYTVIADTTFNYMTLDAAKLATLEDADLIIVSRTTNSGNYASDGTEITQWNSIQTPLILTNAYLTRSNRWQWINSTAITEFQAETMLSITEASHQIFTGVTPVNGQIDMIDNSVNSGQITFINSSDIGNGTLIAQRADDGSVWIAEWEAGVPFYSGTTQVPAEKRMLFTAGGSGGQESGTLNLTENGQKIFLNAVRYMLGLSAKLGYASNPKPSNESVDIPRDMVLSWTPGPYADKHDVYFGTDFDDVNNAGTDSSLLVGPAQDVNSFDAGRLDFERTYYWRVDEVNVPPDSTVFKGPVWNFTVEPFAVPIPGENIIATASSYAVGQGPENTINGSGLDNDLHSNDSTTMWLTALSDPGPAWIHYEFDKPYKLYEILVWNYNGQTLLSKLGLKEVTIEYSTDNTTWVQVGNVTEFAQAPGTAGYAYNTTVALDGIVARYVRITALNNWFGSAFNQYGLSEVRFMVIPVSAREPSPENGATEVALDTDLTWRAGREAAEHNVYFSPDKEAVIKSTAPVVTITEADYKPTSLDLGNTYYWRVDEVNNSETPKSWQGNLWSFTIQEYLVVDDFESYNNIETGQEGSHLVYITWTDGYDNPQINGSTIGYVTGNSLETNIVHTGAQSVPLAYNNSTASYSEVSVNTNQLPIGRDWSKGSAKSLSLWFYGDPNNATTEQMYVKLNDVKVVYEGDLEDIAKQQWTQWDIDLASFGIQLNNVTKLSIGLERITGVSGSGVILIDDIRLYGARCFPSLLKQAGDLNNDCVVNYSDLVIMAEDWLTQPVPEELWNSTLSSQDIGVTTPAGSYSFDGNIYTIQAGGTDIWSTADAFHYAYRQISGDCQMTIRVTDIETVPGSDGWSKAGIMIRQSLDAGSSNVYVAASDISGGGATFQWRTQSGGSSTSQRLLENDYIVTKPACIRLVRQGDLFTGYVFLNGLWQQQGQTTVSMTDPVYIGLAATSHSDGQLTTATLDRGCVFSGAELQRDDIIDFKDFAILANTWLEILLWPDW
jgi:hypothetical protein